MMKKTLVIGAISLMSLLGCDDGYRLAQSSSSEPMADKVADENVNFMNLAERLFQEQLTQNPMMGVFIGDYQYNDGFVDDLSDEYLASQHQLNKKYLTWLNDLDRSKLSPERQISYDILIEDIKNEIAAEAYPSRFLPFSQFDSLMSNMAMLGSGKSAQPFVTVKDYDDFAKRLTGYVAWFDSAKMRLSQGVENKVTLPRVLVKRLLPQIKAQIVDDAKESIFYQPILSLPSDIDAKDAQRITEQYKQLIVTQLVPAYRDLYQFIEQQYLPHTRASAGYGALPNGLAWYQFLANGHTTTTIPVEEIHQLGLNEVKRILEEMDQIRVAVGFKGDLKTFFKHLSSDPSYFFDKKADLVAGYEAYKQTIDKVLPQYFDAMPKSPYVVKPVEAFMEQSAAGASYMTGSPDGSRPGVFYINTYNLKAQPKWGMTTLSLHEAAPGHHFQLSLQQELTGLPKFQRFGGQTAFIEGWALYSEYLGIEMGLFNDPYQLFGKLADEMLRAMRLVVDTGLHAKGWSREQAIQYMLDNSSMAETDVVSEVERYMALPGQALSYKIGQLKIIELRQDAQQRLGDKFDIKQFHNQVLLDGALPLAVLETKLNNWIAKVNSQS